MCRIICCKDGLILVGISVADEHASSSMIFVKHALKPSLSRDIALGVFFKQEHWFNDETLPDQDVNCGACNLISQVRITFIHIWFHGTKTERVPFKVRVR